LDLKDYTNEIIGCAIEVHRCLGPGLLEKAYSDCLKIELLHKGLSFEAEKQVPIIYKDTIIESAFRIDLLVENSCIIELKAIDAVLPVHQAQVLTYMKLIKIKYGLLLNFNVPVLKDGIKRFIL
jgi:GxxExxY protein